MADTIRPWGTGEATIRTMLARRLLEQVPGNPDYTEDLLRRCDRKLKSAGTIASGDPESAYLLAYDAARFLLTALLAAQGLRVKGGGEGGHAAVQEAIEAQFPHQFRFFGRMRRSRNELEYPPLTRAAPTIDAATATERIKAVRQHLAPVRGLVARMPKFR